MMIKKDKYIDDPNELKLDNVQARIENIQSMLDSFKSKADLKAEEVYRSKLGREREVIELLGGGKTSIYEEKQNQMKLLASIPLNYGTKFNLFFSALGDLAGWTDEQRKAYYKPHIAPKIINECIYSRFGLDVFMQLRLKNPYVELGIRKFRHYYFLSEEGIVYLEKFIDEAVTVMKSCTNVYEFRKKYSEKYGLSFQPVLFEDYMGY